MLKILRRIAAGLIGVYLALWALTIYIHYPSPVAAAQLGFADPSQTGKLMPAAEIKATSPRALDASAVDNSDITVSFRGATMPISQFAAETKTNALLVLHHDKLVREMYFNGFDASSQLPSYSVAKSVVSILTGQLIATGKLKESDTFVSFFPEYKTGTDYDKITVGQLIDMASGVAVADNYPDGPAGWGNPIAQLYATTDLRDFIFNHRDLYWAPGSNHEYRSVDTQMMGMIIEKLTGLNLAKVLEQGVGGRAGLWPALGMEQDGTWNLDHDGGIAKAFCCLNISARDYMKLGQAMLHAMQGKDTAVISRDWTNRMSTPVTTLDHGWGYGAFTWHPAAGVNMFLGLHGQFVYVDPAHDVVIVKLSDNKSDGLSEPTVATFAEIVQKLAP